MGNQYSSLKIFHHKDILDKIGQKKRVAPLYIRLKPTNICNQHCEYCAYGSGHPEHQIKTKDSFLQSAMIPWEKMKEIVNDMGNMGVKAVTFSGGGEPLTYPYIIKTIKMLKEKNIDISLISNGQLLSGEIARLFYDAKWIRISFDSPNEEDYMRMRNVSASSFRKVCNNIKDFVKNKQKTCVVGINFVIGKDNYTKVYEAGVLFKSWGVNNVKFTALVDNLPDYHVGIKDIVIEQIHRLKKDIESVDFSIINSYEQDWMNKIFKEQDFPVCYTCRLVSVIAADQKIYYCHSRSYDSSAVVGDISNQSFENMWFSEDVKKRLNQLNPMVDCKSFCVYGERNKLIQAYFDVDYNHINFI